MFGNARKLFPPHNSSLLGWLGSPVELINDGKDEQGGNEVELWTIIRFPWWNWRMIINFLLWQKLKLLLLNWLRLGGNFYCGYFRGTIIITLQILCSRVSQVSLRLAFENYSREFSTSPIHWFHHEYHLFPLLGFSFVHFLFYSSFQLFSLRKMLKLSLINILKTSRKRSISR